MKLFLRILGTGWKQWLILAAVLAGPVALAADTVHYMARPGSKVTIAGTSTIHDWTMEGRIIGGSIDLPACSGFGQSQIMGLADAKVEAFIPVRSLKSAHAGMDEVMQQAMNEKDHPKIQYRLANMTLRQPHVTGSPFVFDTKGDLIVNGVTNQIAWPVTIETIATDKLKITGSLPLKMTDYKIKPPAPDIGLGLIKTGDDVIISIEWLVAAGKPANTR